MFVVLLVLAALLVLGVGESGWRVCSSVAKMAAMSCSGDRWGGWGWGWGWGRRRLDLEVGAVGAAAEGVAKPPAGAPVVFPAAGGVANVPGGEPRISLSSAPVEVEAEVEAG